jgi:hypothetical protein
MDDPNIYPSGFRLQVILVLPFLENRRDFSPLCFRKQHFKEGRGLPSGFIKGSLIRGPD